MRIGFDALTLRAVSAELREFAGARAQKWLQIGPRTIAAELYKSKVQWLVISWDPDFFRVHLADRVPEKLEPTPFLLDIRRRIGDARLVEVQQVGLERILNLSFSSGDGEFSLVLELMGRHANVLLLDSQDKVLAAAKTFGPQKSRRPVLPGGDYASPVLEKRPSILKAVSGDDLRDFEGASPFLIKLIQAGLPLPEVQDRIKTSRFEPVTSEIGPYPVPIDILGYPTHAAESMSAALNWWFQRAESERGFQQLQNSLLSQVIRVYEARTYAVEQLEQAESRAAHAGEIQRLGELLLAYQHSIPAGADKAEVWDYDGNPVTIQLDPELSPAECAEKLFHEARKAKEGAAHVHEQRTRLGEESDELRALLTSIENAPDTADLEKSRVFAEAKRWLHKPTSAKNKEDRPFEGKRVKELLGPRSYRVLYGENAEANDYLTLRIAKPNDWWLHVRGSVSAHVIVPTQNQPDRVPPEVLRYAAEIAVKNSPMKHSSYVPVDVTLKKYVRRQKGGALGSVIYSHEKTIHVELN